jgi:putative ATPase
MAIDKAIEDVKHIRISGVPNHLRDRHYPGAAELGHGDNYRYAHDYPNHYVEQQYLPDELVGNVYYSPSDNGYEREIQNWFKKIKKENRQ